MFRNATDSNASVCACPFALQGNCPKVSSINDRNDWKLVRKALSVIGFSDDEVEVREHSRISQNNFIPQYVKIIEEMYNIAHATYMACFKVYGRCTPD